MPKKILTIDDDPYIVKYITEVLSDNGYATCSASSVEEALSVLEAERPDLVTLDMEMPDEWGPRFYRKMSMNPAFKDTPVIVIDLPYIDSAGETQRLYRVGTTNFSAILQYNRSYFYATSVVELGAALRRDVTPA